MTTNDTKFSKEKILALPFASKLWITASLEHRTCIKWGPRGESILLDLADLDNHLRSLQSMFRAKDCNEFLLNLRDHGFKLVPQNEVNSIEFRHKFFARGRMEYLCMIVNESPDHKPDKKTQERMKFNAEFRMSADLCMMKHGSWTQLQSFQAKTRIAMEFNAAQYALKTALEKRTALGVPIPAHLFKRPAECILELPKDSAFFGYHGEVTEAALEKFFGEHKPSLRPPRETTPGFELPSDTFNMDFLNPQYAEPEESNSHTVEPSHDNMIKYEDLLPDDFDLNSTNSDTMDLKPRDESDDEVFEDDDHYIEPMEESAELAKDDEIIDMFDLSWLTGAVTDEAESNTQAFDSLPDLNSFFEEESVQNQTGVPFPSQSRFFNDR